MQKDTQKTSVQQRVKKPLTPVEQLRRLDDEFQRALAVKRKTLLELYGEQESIIGKLEKAKSSSSTRKNSAVTGTPSEARDLALAAMVQAHCLLEAIYDGTKAQDLDSGPTAKESGSPRKTSIASPSKRTKNVTSTPGTKQSTVPSVPCSRLACISAPLMKCLTALSQSCALMERELQQSRKELQSLRTGSANVTIKVDTVDGTLDTQNTLPIARPSDLPLIQCHQAGEVNQAQLAPKKTAQKEPVVTKSTKTVQPSCMLLTASFTPSQARSGGKLDKNQPDVMSKSLPSKLHDDERGGESEDETSEDRRRKRSLQRRWRHVRASLASLGVEQRGSER